MYFHLCCNSFEVYEMIVPIFLTHQRPKSLVFGDVNVMFSISFALFFQEKSNIYANGLSMAFLGLASCQNS